MKQNIQETNKSFRISDVRFVGKQTNDAGVQQREEHNKINFEILS